MKRSIVLLSFFVLAIGIGAGRLSLRHVQAQGRGRGNNPEAAAARERQLALEKATPQLQINEEVLSLGVPGHTIGETEGVSKNSKGHLFVYSRTGKGGNARGGTAAELFEFDQNLKFVKEWGQDNYAASSSSTRLAWSKWCWAESRKPSTTWSASWSARRRTRIAIRSETRAPSTGKPT